MAFVICKERLFKKMHRINTPDGLIDKYEITRSLCVSHVTLFACQCQLPVLCQVDFSARTSQDLRSPVLLLVWHCLMSGKHYNRCWLVHEAFSEALERLFIEQCLPTIPEKVEEFAQSDHAQETSLTNILNDDTVKEYVTPLMLPELHRPP
ncbi:Hypothetical predicted protein [Paramuricea clavata]|uniref:Uncharacterized protein n=1 Tax=Paramuricea clavata TaxID=317549 RepID=A0A6S7HJZ8_PARCT|nr:Hypothetical predicted protein [Paramuricea clavata]